MSTVPDIIRDIEARLQACGVSVARVCRMADLDRSAWHRWKAGAVPPRAKKWGAVRAALRPIIGEVPDLPAETPRQRAA